MSPEVAVLEPIAVVITIEQTDLIKRTICHGATDAEMQLFFFDCQRRGTHPLDKLIHFTKRDGKYTPVTSIDFFRLRAHSSGAYAGEGATTYELAEDGLPNECTVAVLRIVQGQVCTWRATARWAEYYPGEKSGFMWRKMPFLMLAKCAEALALRKAFPAELQGLYVKEEMDQAEPAPLATTKTFAEKFPEQAQKIQDKLKAKVETVVEQPDTAPPVDNGVRTAPPADGSLQAHDAPEEPQLESYCDKLALSQSPKDIADVMNAALAQDWPASGRKTLQDHKDQAMKRLTPKK